jgi:hypothetical protein
MNTDEKKLSFGLNLNNFRGIKIRFSQIHPLYPIYLWQKLLLCEDIVPKFKTENSIRESNGAPAPRPPVEGRDSMVFIALRL